MPKNVIVDTGFWFALFDERDQYHEEAQIIVEDISVHTVIVPWPTLYEALNTRFIRRNHELAKFNAFIKKPSTLIIDDGPYRPSSLEYVLDEQPRHQSYSLVDHILRSMLSDRNLLIDAMVTFNARDFYDVCDTHRIEMPYR